MTSALLLIVFGVLTRIVDHPQNFVPMGALAIYAGARLPRKWAFIVPVGAMLLSDLIIDNFKYPGFDRPLLDPVRLAIYGTMFATAAMGLLLRRKSHPATLFSFSLLASCLFFVTTNLAEWAGGSIGYPKTGAGLVTCFAAAVPFFHNTLAADLLGTAFLFGTEAVWSRVKARRLALATPAE